MIIMDAFAVPGEEIEAYAHVVSFTLNAFFWGLCRCEPLTRTASRSFLSLSAWSPNAGASTQHSRSVAAAAYCCCCCCCVLLGVLFSRLMILRRIFP